MFQCIKITTCYQVLQYQKQQRILQCRISHTIPKDDEAYNVAKLIQYQKLKKIPTPRLLKRYMHVYLRHKSNYEIIIITIYKYG